MSKDKQPFRYVCPTEFFVKEENPQEKGKRNPLYQWLITPKDCEKCCKKMGGCDFGKEKIVQWNETYPDKRIDIGL
jgi:hypothetical protein